MDFGAITTRPCENVLPPPDPRCADPAFAIANPGICPPTPILIIKPGLALCCELGSIQFKAFTIFGDIETDVTDQATFTSSDMDIAVVGAGSGNATATGISAGTATIGATYNGMQAHSSLTVLALETNCCANTEVAMVVLVDTSLSMSQGFSPSYSTKLAFARAAATRFISEVYGPKDLVGLDSFNSDNTLTIATPSHNQNSVAVLVPTIIQTQSDTAFYAGLQQAISDLDATDAGLKVILLISDGLSTVPETNNPYLLLSDFKAQGGVVMCLGVRAASVGFAVLSAFSTPGFFVNAYNGVDADALDFISGLKGYICAGNCTPAGDVVVNKGQLDYHNFINWDVVDGDSVPILAECDYTDPDLFFTVTTSVAHGYNSGDQITISGARSFGVFNGTFTITVLNTLQFTCPVSNQGSAFGERGLSARSDPTPGSVDLLGNGFFDLLPGNGLYVDLISGLNASPPFNGQLVSKNSFLIGGGDPISLNVNLHVQRAMGPPTLTAHGTTVDGDGNPIAHGLTVGKLVQISGAANGFFNNTFLITAVTDTTFTFTINNPGGSGILQDSGMVTILTSAKNYRLTVSLAGNQLVDRDADQVAVQVYWLNGDDKVFLLNQQVNISNYKQGFTDYAFTFPVTDPVVAYISIQQLDIPTVESIAGILLDHVKLDDLSNLVTLLDDNFDNENPVYVPPRCGRGTYYNPASGYAYGYNCYGYGCLTEPPPMQQPDPNPLVDIESGSAPPTQTYTSTQTRSASCGSGFANFVGCDSYNANSCSTVEQVFTSFGYQTFIFRYQLFAAQAALSYELTRQPSSATGPPTAWTFEGSDDGVNWTVIDTQSAQTFLSGETKVFNVTDTTPYLYFRINATNGAPQETLFHITLTAPQQAEGTATATSTISQGDADSKAAAAALAIAQSKLNCQTSFTSTQSYTASCPAGVSGNPGVVTATATAVSSISQADADAIALAAAKAEAESQLVCNTSNNTDPIIITDRAPGSLKPQAASPYPSIDITEGGGGVITDVTVNLLQFTHDWPSDVCVVLKGPDGTTCVLMAGCGNGGFSVSGINLEINDGGGAMPQSGQLVDGTYAPTNYPPFADVPAPGPVSPYGTTLSVLNGKDPNGPWTLWVCDQETNNAGVFQGGWSISLTTA